jgi:1,4-alpha-glucan branching enzyme
MAMETQAPDQHSGQMLTEMDLLLFNEGTHTRLYQKFGAHLTTQHGQAGAQFAVWAPNARAVSVIGDFNHWNKDAHPLHMQGTSGVWTGFIPGVRESAAYKYHIESHHGGHQVNKADPYGFYHELAPRTASLVWDLHYEWHDQEWMRERGNRFRLEAPVSIYEVHLGSWRRSPEDGKRFLTYREMAQPLADYVHHMGFTHVEFLPLLEHPFYGSWGYQTTGYFAPTSRYGTPQDLMFLIDYLHQRGIGVILDWVPSHFPSDEHGLAYFDGTHLYEHGDPRKGFHPDWASYIFNYGRHEVRSFLMSSAFFWLDKYHIDGLRVDAVASMLYLDYSRKAGEWIPNQFGGKENLEAIDFLRHFNEDIYREFPDVQTIAEESTAYPMVSKPLYLGGLGFGYKWDMGFMHDTLEYIRYEPVHRKYHQNQLTFRGLYTYTENFILPYSHDEVVHGKGSLLARMPGDTWQKFANYRALLGYMYLQPGKKLLFMGCEFAQGREWSHEGSLDWDLLGIPWHQGIQKWVEDLNRAYRGETAMHNGDSNSSGFEWIDCNDSEQSTISWIRWNWDRSEALVAVFNFTPVPRTFFKVGVPKGGFWKEILNSDAPLYGGSGQGNYGGVQAAPVGFHGRPYTLLITLPPLAGVVFKYQGES